MWPQGLAGVGFCAYLTLALPASYFCMLASIKQFFAQVLVAVGIISAPVAIPPQNIPVPEPQAIIQEQPVPESAPTAPKVSVPTQSAPVEPIVAAPEPKPQPAPVVVPTPTEEPAPVVKPEPVSKKADGVCGSLANTIVPTNFDQKKLCTVGSSYGLKYLGNQMSWGCTGQYGGQNTSCYATKAITEADLPPAPPKVNGVCSTSQGKCVSGTASGGGLNLPGTSYIWTCSGSNGGASAQCSVPKEAPKPEVKICYAPCYSGLCIPTPVPCAN